MKKSTITDLPNDIRAAIPENERDPFINTIIEEAEAGEFHDYKNQKYVCGKMQVAQMLYQTQHPKLLELRLDIMNGVYDESPDEEDKAAMKKDWIADGGTEESFKSLFGG